MTDEQVGRTGIQRSILVGLGYEGARICLILYRRLITLLGWHPPLVRYLILAHEEEIQALHADFSELDQAVTDGVISLLPAAIFTPLGAEFNARSAAYTWLFESTTEIEARLNLFVNFVKRGDHQPLLQRRGLDMQPSTRLNYYLVGGLKNTLTSGLFIDLTYLITNLSQIPIANGIGKEQLAFVHGIFLLPGFTGEDRVTKMDAEDEGQNEFESIGIHQSPAWLNGNAYAALKELHYYMSGKPYQSKQTADGRIIEFDAISPPFQDSLCFLVSPNREQEDAAIALDDAMYTVADWLGFRIAAPSSGAFQLDDATLSNRFAGLGLSTWVLPRPELTTYCSHRLVHELFQNVLLTGAPEEIGASWRADWGLNSDHIRRILQDRGDWPSQLRKFVERIGATGRLDAPLLDQATNERQLLQADDQHRRQLDEVRRVIGYDPVRDLTGDKLGQLREEILHKMVQQANQHLDTHPQGGLHQMINTFRQLEGEIKGEYQRLANNLERLQNQRAQVLGVAIDQHWARYRYIVASFVPLPLSDFWLPIMPLLLVFLFTILPLALWLAFTNPTDDHTLPYAVAGISLCFSGWIILAWYRHLRKLRNDLQGFYADRQRRDLEIEIERGVVKLWEGFSSTCSDILHDLNNLREKLQTMANKSQMEFQEERFRVRLFECPRYASERSVLTPPMVEELYERIRLTDAADQPQEHRLQELFKAMALPYHAWAKQPSREIFHRIEGYIAQLNELTQLSLVDLLERKYSDNRLQQMLQTGFNLTAPLLDVDTSALPQDAGLQKLTYFSQLKENSKTRKILDEILAAQNQNHRYVLSHNADFLAHLALRDSVPMSAIRSVRNLYPHYAALRRAGKLTQLHVEGRALLPDMLSTNILRPSLTLAQWKPLEQMISDHRELTMWAILLKTLRYNAATEQYQFAKLGETERYLRRIGQRVEPINVNIGGSKEEAATYLLTYNEEFQTLLTQTQQALNVRIQQGYENDEKKLAAALYQYKAQEKADLTPWEIEILDKFLKLIIERNPIDEYEPDTSPEVGVYSAVRTAKNTQTKTKDLLDAEQKTGSDPLDRRTEPIFR